MRIFVDTSAFLSILDENELNHQQAARLWRQLLEDEAILISTSYVILETIALVQRRLGLPFVKAFQERVVPSLQIEWVEESLHKAGMAALLTANQRRLGIVDCTSFEVMRQLNIDVTFAFDQHFVEQGFTCLT